MAAAEKTRWLKLVLLGVVLLVAVGAYVGWYKFFREEPQPDWVTATPDMRFMYGSIGGEHDAGIPYWIFVVLPRMFPDLLPGPGGYASLGVPWEQGRELPAGFTRKVIGFPRVGNNCAVCHTTTYRATENDDPTFVVAGPGHTTNVEAFFSHGGAAAPRTRKPGRNPSVLLEFSPVGKRELNWCTDNG